MFDENQDQQTTNDDHSGFTVGSTDTSAPAPAPGAPIGPLDNDIASPLAAEDHQLAYASVDEPADESSAAPSADDNTAAAPAADAPKAPAPTVPSDELLGIKQEALQQLSPLVGQLEQTPEETFRTVMMMIQASDDQTLIKNAYDAAKQISDEKARAQALLDVVNEINYFTQQHNS